MMLKIPAAPEKNSFVRKERSSESIEKEKMENKKLLELGIDPYQYDIEEKFTEEEQGAINEALKWIALEKEVPKELMEKVRQITAKQ